MNRFILAMLAASSTCAALFAAEPGAVPKPASPKAPAKPLPTFTEVAAPTSVKVVHKQKLIAVPLKDLCGKELPAFLVDAVGFARQSGKQPPDVACGRIEFEAAADGPLVVAASYAYDGNTGGDWVPEKWNEAKFAAEGWKLVAELPLFNYSTAEPQPHKLFVRQCKAGEKFAIRSRKYHPPIVIVPSSAKLADASAIPAIVAAAPVKPATSAKPAQPKPPTKLTELPPPDAVRITHVTSFIAAPIAELRVDDSLPKYLDGAVVLTRPIAKYAPDPEAGLLKFEALKDGPLFVAVGQRYDGYIFNQMWHEREFYDAGFLPLQFVMLRDTATNRGEKHLLYVRECKAGEKFAVRPHLNYPPVLIVAANGTDVPKVAAHESDPAHPEIFQAMNVRARTCALLDAERYDDLEAMLGGYLKTDAHFPSGASKFAESYHPFTIHKTPKWPEDKILRRLERCESWIKQKPDTVAGRVILAKLCLFFAWQLQWDEDLKDRESRREEVHRRALEVLYDAQQTGSLSPDLYAVLLELANEQNWDEELSMQYVEQVLAAGRWCPEMVKFMSYNLRIPDDLQGDEAKRQRKAKRDALYDLALKHLGPKFGDAVYAASFAQEFIHEPETVFAVRGQYDWPRAKASFEDWDKHFPNSRRVWQLYARYACSNGDRAAAAEMFKRLGDFKYDEEDVWNYEPDFQGDRVWAAADFPTGDQRTLIEHPLHTIGGLAWVDDGRRLLFADGAGRLYQCTDEGKPERLLDLTIQTCYALAATPDGDRVIGGARLTDMAFYEFSTKTKRGLRTEHGDIEHVVLTKNGKRALIGHQDGAVTLFDLTDLENRKPVREILTTQGKRIRAVGLAADGASAYVVLGDGKVRAYDLDTVELKAEWAAHPTVCGAAAVAADGSHLCTSVGGTHLCLWKPDGTKLWDVTMTGPHPTCVAISPDQKCVAISTGLSYRVGPGEVRFYALSDGRLLKTCVGHKAGTSAIAFAPDGKTLATASLDRSIRLWDVPQP